jgi:Cu-Zn family superoxide dismutase
MRRVAATLVLLLLGCARSSDQAPEAAGHALAAVAELAPVPGSAAHGTVTMTFQSGGVRVIADLEGLTPGAHSFTILAASACAPADSLLPPAHFNPTAQPHGDGDASQRHLGDLGNVMADASGHAHFDRFDRSLTLEGPEAIVGHVLAAHARADQPTVQPDGDAGPVVACGVIALRPTTP